MNEGSCWESLGHLQWGVGCGQSELRHMSSRMNRRWPGGDRVGKVFQAERTACVKAPRPVRVGVWPQTSCDREDSAPHLLLAAGGEA